MKTTHKHFIIKISSYRAHQMKNKQKENFKRKKIILSPRKKRNMYVCDFEIDKNQCWQLMGSNLGPNHMKTIYGKSFFSMLHARWF